MYDACSSSSVGEFQASCLVPFLIFEKSINVQVSSYYLQCKLSAKMRFALWPPVYAFSSNFGVKSGNWKTTKCISRTAVDTGGQKSLDNCKCTRRDLLFTIMHFTKNTTLCNPNLCVSITSICKEVKYIGLKIKYDHSAWEISTMRR